MKKIFYIMITALLSVCIAAIANPAYAETDFDSWGLTAPPSDDVTSITLEDKSTPGKKIVPIDKDFKSADKKDLRLTMTGLTGTNRLSMLAALRTSFLDSGEGSDTPIKVKNSSFIDAEKWDVTIEPYTEYYFGYDTLQCWAAANSNMLWMSGWTDGLTNPRTGKPFKSEDDIFEYYNVNFSDQGSNSDRGIDWFFMGEYFLSGIVPGAHTMDDSSGGLFPDFVSSIAQTQHDLVEAPSEIESMLKVAADDPADRSVFEVNVGPVPGNELSAPRHAVTGIGLITDPSADDIADRYKAIILIDSDNDGQASAIELAKRDKIMSKYEGTEPFSDEWKAITAELVKYKESRKEIRPNSYTVYKLKYSTDINGIPYWELVGYSDDETTAIYDINELRCPSAKLIAECTEDKGSANVNSEVDFTLDELFTTSNEESAEDPYSTPTIDAKKYEFDQGDPVNINYFLANRSNVILDESYPGGNKVSVDWVVTRDSDGSTVASGSTRQAFDNYKRHEVGAMLYLNKTASGYERWQPGAYTATVSFNKDEAFRESYYKNNIDKTLHFTVKEKSEPQKETAEKAANTLKAAGRSISLRANKLRKKACAIKRSKAITIKNAKGAVTYKKVQVSKKNKSKKYIKKAKYSKKITVNQKTGKITVKKGLKKGTYKLKVKVYAAGDENYEPATKTVTVKIKVR